MKSTFWRVLFSAVILTLIAQIVHTIGAMLGMNFYTDPNYASVWSKIMMPKAGPPPAEFMYYSLAFSAIGMLIFTIIYRVIKNGVPGTSVLKKGLMYGVLVFLVATVPGMLSLILLINLPLALVGFWTVESLIIQLLGGIVVAKINRQ